MVDELKIPEKIKILDRLFKIIYFDKSSEVDDRGVQSLWGLYCRYNHTIRVFKNAKSPDCEIWHTIIHETIHAITDILKISQIDGLEDKEKESVVNLLTIGINASLHDNKLRFDFPMDGESHEENLPKTLKILDRQFDVVYVDKPSEVDINGQVSLWGSYYLWRHEIRIYRKGDFAYFEVWNTIIQQVIEVIIDLLEISSIEDLGYEERLRVINQLATGLNSVMFDNHFRFDLPLSKEV